MKKNIDNDTLSYEEKYLLKEIASTINAIETAYSNFENATDPDLIDCYIFQLNSEQKRYKYLINQAKQTQFQNKELELKFVSNKNLTPSLIE